MAGQHAGIWKKRILLPLWIIQLIASVIFLAIAALALWWWNKVEDNVTDDFSDDDAEEFSDAMDAGAAINLSFSIFTILMIFVEMILLCTHRLAPVAHLVIQCIKSAIWTFYLIITIIAATQGASSGGAIFLVLVLFLTSIALLAYGATIVHRKRKGTLSRGNYAAASMGNTTYEPNRYSQTTDHTSGPNPFRDPSPTPPYNPVGTHTAQQPAGEAAGYYGPGGSYEMGARH